jgi:hypothetical protein
MDSVEGIPLIVNARESSKVGAEFLLAARNIYLDIKILIAFLFSFFLFILILSNVTR